MLPIKAHLSALSGRVFGAHDLVAIYSARLDEAGTDGRSRYVVVGGAVATASQWGKLESAWGLLLNSSRIPAYHWKEFNDPNNAVFGVWSAFKRKRFIEKQEKIINRNTVFRVSIGLDSAVHADIKRRMRGIKGFFPDSDYSLCLRYLMIAAFEELVKVDPDCRLTIMVEDGPWAGGAAASYQRVTAMTCKPKPARHAHRLAGFMSVPKGIRPSLEVADYLVGEELARMVAGRRPKPGGQMLSVLLTQPMLEKIYGRMIEEKEKRRAFHAAKPKTTSGQSA